MKKLFALLSLAAVAAFAQLTEKIEVRVVNVDVTVTGPDGMPVRGLTKNDFQLFEDGKPQPITNFYAVTGVAAAAPAAALAPAPGAGAATPDDPRFRRKVLVLIDNNHITPYARNVALQKLEDFIDDRFHAGEYDWSIAAVGTRVGIVMPLTSDKARIHSVLDTIKHLGIAPQAQRTPSPNDPSLPSNLMRDIDLETMKAASDARLGFSHDMDDRERLMQAQYTTTAIVDAARGFAGASGKKIVLLLTDDPGLNDVETSFVTHDGGLVQRDFITKDRYPFAGETAAGLSKLKQTLVEEANSSNVSFYIMNVAGLQAMEEEDIAAGAPKTATNNAAGFWIAEQTGGRLMPGNNPIESLRTFETASSNFYSLGFHPAHADDGKYHKLTVKLTKPGNYKLQHRAGYSNVPDDAQLARALQSEITTSIDNASLPVQLTLEAPQPQPDRGIVLIPFRAKLPMDKLQFLPVGNNKWKATIDIWVSAFDEHGRNIVLRRFTTSAVSASANPDPGGTFVYRNGVLMRKGANQRLVVALRDVTTDAVGMADTMVKTE